MDMKKHSQEIFDKIGNKSDYLRLMNLTGKSMKGVKKMNCFDAIEILAIDNVSNV